MKRIIATIIEGLLIGFFSYYYLVLYGGNITTFAVIMLFIILFTSISALWIFYLYQTLVKPPKLFAPTFFWLGVIVLLFIISLFTGGGWTALTIFIIILFFFVITMLSIPFYWIVPRPSNYNMPKKHVERL